MSEWQCSLRRVVSGGQSGVDRAALDAARSTGLAIGGWCPAGRWAEDGTIAAHYPLRETPSADPAERTVRNVRDSDGTLVLTWGTPTGGTALTVEAAAAQGKPLLVLDLGEAPDLEAAYRWRRQHRVRTLNVAGPRASESPGVYDVARRWLERFFAQAKSG